MRVSISLSLFALAALAVAVPYPQEEDPDVETSVAEPSPTFAITIADPTLPIPLSTSLNIPVTVPSALPTGEVALNSTSTRRRKSHWEPIPIFSKSCDCPALATVAYPCWATDALQRCNFEELHSYVCWTSANFGCPSPTRSCDSLFQPTPVTGKNPCELGPNTGGNPTITDAPVRRWQDLV
ncbi:hypothetical protein BU26DRAFT_335728 [Trematosphaeria pertusa]|uniref:Extracellular membrane protein CFEM domain-containing protein n=1 Tax=Trematosphaeria pertusa TaxID=390896 RepID=A0A6A6IEI8_9PLEO|nr:uncharacterized protein BU26DRAFT_335728 [Trematosphaeria pertusa]KAF2248478.1 hypothetical protein BU26DRAFT_335728 [Trematosphaeria pertusa]